MDKKGQDSGSAAGIIFIIAGILILYILLMPSDELDIILEESSAVSDNGNGEEGYLLDEHIGRLDYRASDEKVYRLNSFVLQTRTEADVVASRNNLMTKKGVFEEEIAGMDFQVNPELTGDLTLAFNVQSSSGVLTIKLNDNIIYRGEMSEGNSPHFLLENRYLESHNTLTFEVSSPGFVFWRINNYDLSNIQVVGDVTDDTESSSSQTINIRSSDFDLMETARLRFLPVCNDDVSGLSIEINEREVFRGKPDCNVFNHIDLAKDNFFPGVNFLDFKVSRGRVLMDNAEIVGNLDTPEPPVYYFELDKDDFENDRFKDEVIAGIDFTNPDRKRLELFVNGRIIGITTSDTSVERDITEFVKEGSNSIELRPRQNLDISSLRVWIE